jgi:hypothetical protein
MKRIFKIQFLLTAIFGLSCNETNNMDNRIIEVNKRDKLVEKYNLLNFHKSTEPIYISVDEFFDDNNDLGSIAPNIDVRPSNKEYWDMLKELEKNERITKIFIPIKDINIYENSKLDSSEWVYTDEISFITSLDEQEMKSLTKILLPDEVYKDTTTNLLDKKDHNKMNVITIWWD